MTLASCRETVRTITVSNTLDFARQEMVEVVLDDSLCSVVEPMVLLDAAGKEVAYQKTYDGKMVFVADVPANGSSDYTLHFGKTPSPIATVATGAVYPNRVDDIAWENDRIAFRAYGPALQASGEKAYGYDVWVKRVEEPVVDVRYAQELNTVTLAQIAQLREEGKADEADALYQSVSYHVDHGNGLDCYKVGPTLGGGATALLVDGKIIYPYCYKSCDILDNGPLRFTVRLVYNPTEIAGKQVTETRLITLDKGSQLNRTIVSYEGVDDTMVVVAGPVVHHAGGGNYIVNDEVGYVAYQDPTDNPANGNGDIFVGAAFPMQLTSAQLELYDEEEAAARGAYGHVLGYMSYKPGDQLTYYWGAGWSKWGFADFATWADYMCRAAQSARTPLTIE